jgi:hypothetical protein
MTTIVRSTANTQFVAANTASQLLSFKSCGSLLVNVTGNICFVNIGTANTVTATVANATSSSSSVPVQPGTPVVLSTGQSFNQTPGTVYVAVISGTTGSVFVTPVEAQ